MRVFMGLLPLVGFCLLRCSGGASIGIPAIKPPVEAITPSALVSAASVSAVVRRAEEGAFCEENNIYQRVKCRLFSDGPTEILEILADTDNRMAEIDERAQQSQRTCLNEAAIDKTDDFSFPGGETFPHYLQCYDVFEGDTGWMAFGKKDGVWYLREGFYGPAGTSGVNKGIGKIVRIDAQENVEGWIMIGLSTTPPTESTVLLHLKTNKSAATVEFTAGGENTGFDTVHFKSNESYIYLKDDSAEYCLSSSDYIETEASSCVDLKGSLELTTLGCKGGTGCTGDATTANNVDLTLLYEMGKLPITGVPRF